MSRKLRIALIVAATVVGALMIAGSVAIATGVGDDDQPLTGSTLEQAAEAALASTGGGQVVETEVGDDGAAYGVEIVLPDGRQVEVQLDSSFRVIGTGTDEDTPGEIDD